MNAFQIELSCSYFLMFHSSKNNKNTYVVNSYDSCTVLIIIPEIIHLVKRRRGSDARLVVINYANSYRAHNSSSVPVIMELLTSDSLGFSSFSSDRHNCFFNAKYQPYIGP